jgi:hypothetical protein
METAPSYRNNAIWAGIFFMTAAAFLFLGEALYWDRTDGRHGGPAACAV